MGACEIVRAPSTIILHGLYALSLAPFYRRAWTIACTNTHTYKIYMLLTICSCVETLDKIYSLFRSYICCCTFALIYKIYLLVSWNAGQNLTTVALFQTFIICLQIEPEQFDKGQEGKGSRCTKKRFLCVFLCILGGYSARSTRLLTVCGGVGVVVPVATL